MELLCFILGFIFASYIIPILDGISTWFLAWVEVKKSQQGEIVNKIAIRVQKATNKAMDDETPKRTIGFSYEDDTYEMEEEDEENDL